MVSFATLTTPITFRRHMVSVQANIAPNNILYTAVLNSAVPPITHVNQIAAVALAVHTTLPQVPNMIFVLGSIATPIRVARTASAASTRAYASTIITAVKIQMTTRTLIIT